MNLHRLLLTAFCTLCLSGVAHADLETFITDVNASYAVDTHGFQDQLVDRFAMSDARFRMVVLTVDSPADAVVTLWLHEQFQLPLSRILHCYQARGPQGWDRVLSELGIAGDSAVLRSLQSGELDWHRQVAGLH